MDRPFGFSIDRVNHLQGCKKYLKVQLDPKISLHPKFQKLTNSVVGTISSKGIQQPSCLV